MFVFRAKMEKTLYMRLEELYLKQTISLNSLQVIDGKYCCWETEMDENNPHGKKTDIFEYIYTRKDL